MRWDWDGVVEGKVVNRDLVSGRSGDGGSGLELPLLRIRRRVI